MSKCFRCRTAPAQSKCSDCGSLYCSQECFDQDLEDGQHDYIQSIIYGFQYIAAKKRKRDDKGKEEEEEENGEPEYETGEKKGKSLASKPSLAELESFILKQPDVARHILLNILEPADTLAVCAASKIIYDFCIRKGILDELYKKHFAKLKIYGLVVLNDIGSKKLFEWFKKKANFFSDNDLKKYILPQYNLTTLEMLFVEPGEEFEFFLNLIQKERTKEALLYLRLNKNLDPSLEKAKAVTEASRQGNIELVRALLEDPRIGPDADLTPALIQALKRRDQDVAMLLLHDKRIDPTHPGLIAKAARYGSNKVIRWLLEDGRANPSEDNNVALVLAARAGKTKTVKLLLSDPRVDPNARYGTRTALEEAFNNDRVDMVKVLLSDERVDPSFESQTGFYKSILQWAVVKGQLEIVKHLLADQRIQDAGIPSYIVPNAAANGHYEILELLLQDKSRDPSANDNAALRVALKNHKKNVIPLLLRDKRVRDSLSEKMQNKLKIY